jgi:regulatory protein
VTILGRSHDKPPLDSEALERLALAYVGRYATSKTGLSRYLKRKIAERGFIADSQPDIPEMIERFARLGYIDDRALAEARGRSLARRGYGARRLDGALTALGIAEADGADAREEARNTAWQTALRFAERRRIGPFAATVPDDKQRRRAFAMMMRAGHSVEHVRKIISAHTGIVPTWDE